MKYDRYFLRDSIFIGFFSIWAIASWVTHVIVCIKAKEWLFMIAGALTPPIACVHGTGVWLGVW